MPIIAFNNKCALWKNPKSKLYHILQASTNTLIPEEEEGLNFLVGDLKHPIKTLKEAKIKFLLESI